jgi:exo-1,4-beta-D-glucosaminidase
MKTVDESGGICDKGSSAHGLIHQGSRPPLDRGRGRHVRLSHGRAVLGVVSFLLAAASLAFGQETIALGDGWQIQSSAVANEKAEVISAPEYKAAGWFPASVPSTMVGALLAAKAPGYDLDPFWGMNLRKLPGVTYPIAKNFSHFPMPADSPFAKPWWYRRPFDLPASFAGKRVWLRFEGINYRADVWVNGSKVADQQNVVGTFRRYELDVTAQARPGANAVAVLITPPTMTDMALTWVDWSPMPADRNAGLYQPVSVSSSGVVAIRHPHVVTRVAPSNDSARLTVTAEATNAGSEEAVATVHGEIEGIAFERQVTLRPGETRLVEFDPDLYPQLAMKSPRLWWPYRLGSPEMYTLELTAHASGALSDRQSVRFGIREVTPEMTPNGALQIRVNGKPILIRGGGWASDMMLRLDQPRLLTEMRYVKAMNLNTIRLEGKPESDAFYDIADREGILVMTGWCCCDQWEQWKKWSSENRAVAVASLRDQLRRLRNHPSVVTWMNASDGVAAPDAERAYLDVLKEVRWPNAIVSSASKDVSTVTGPSGVKMNGPYDYVPPRYWLEDTQHGGAFGFNTETSPGPAIPPVETLKEILPEASLWPIDKFWLFHAGGQEFASIDRFNIALAGRYGKPRGLTDYVRKAEAMAYDGERAMFEAFGRNRAQAPGVIQWMLNNSWPSIIWHLYDYQLRPAGGFFGTKKACEPLHVQYSYDDRSVVVVNDHGRDFKNLKISAALFDGRWTQIHAQGGIADASALSSTKVFTLDEVAGLPATYFLRLRATDAGGAEVSRNFYWLSTRPDVIDYTKHDWWGAPVTQHGDFTLLQDLPEVALDVRYGRGTGAGAGESALRARVSNPSSTLAFFVRLKVVGDDGADVKPAFWDDNYFELAPGETREVGVVYADKDLKGTAQVAVDGWNVKPAIGRSGL